ncbi:TonB-dependent receptor domain-containing protein [Methylorubrum sp. Q1]|uniref:TonB-dependent receptor domain-containing protein n=1 Tax=Methylorubrum sp. Q1 TaxID=2562453 RepID=UPI001FE017BF|nr:TonB-dependent receptor [Methylorubrum sp. Q1]
MLCSASAVRIASIGGAVKEILWRLGAGLRIVMSNEGNSPAADTVFVEGTALAPSGERSFAGAVVQDEIRYSSWLRLIGALRYDHDDLSGDGFRSSSLHLYGASAEGCRAPSITETLVQGIHPFPAFGIRPNPNLRPETAHNIECSVNLKYNDVLLPGDVFRAKLNVFHNTVDEFIGIQSVGPTFFVPALAGIPASICARIPGRFPCVIPVRDFQYRNIAQAERRGVELEGANEWGAGFVTLAATHTDGRDRATGETLVTVPPNRLGTTMRLRILDGNLTVASHFTFVEARTDLPAGTAILATEDYGLVDFFGSDIVNDRVRADFVRQNAFYKRYTQYLNALPNPSLTAKAAISIKFATH